MDSYSRSDEVATKFISWSFVCYTEQAQIMQYVAASLYLQHLNSFLISELQGFLQILHNIISTIQVNHQQSYIAQITAQSSKIVFTCRGSNGYCLFIVSSSFLQFSVKCLNIDTNKPSIISQTCVEKTLNQHSFSKLK